MDAEPYLAQPALPDRPTSCRAISTGLGINMPTTHSSIEVRAPANGRKFLTARWVNLGMINYAINPELLQPLLPIDCVPDLAPDGLARCSLVAFDFLDTRVLGIGWPWHTNFAEFNLRCYVRRGERRGVFFVREFVPRLAIATMARWIYNEPYYAVPISSQTSLTDTTIEIDHTFRVDGKPQRLRVHADRPASLPPIDHNAEWYKEHRWGFGTSHRGRALTYEVNHPRWAIYPNASAIVEIDFAHVYGLRWAVLQNATPESVLLIEGSGVSVSPYHETK